MIIIPAIDIIEGKAVRLTQGDYSRKKEYADDPVKIARQFEEASIKQVHVVDLDGAKASQPVNLELVRQITAQTNLKVDFGGGIKSDSAIEKAFAAGVHQITAGSIAVKNKKLVKDWMIRFGTEKIIIGADVRNEKIVVNGWQEDSGLNVFEFLMEYFNYGAEYCVCTDVSKDGLLEGPSFDLYKRIRQKFPGLKLIASGGVAAVTDLCKLAEIGVYAAIVGKAFYEGRISADCLRQEIV